MTMYQSGPGNTAGEYPPPLRSGGRVRFDAISEGFRLLGEQMGTWVLAMLLCLAVGVIVGSVMYALLLASILPGILASGGRSNGQLPGTFWLAYLVYIIVNVIAGAFLVAGLFRMAIKQVRGEGIQVGDLFGASDVVGRLIGASILVYLAAYAAELIPVVPVMIAAPKNSGLIALGFIIGILAAMFVFVVCLLTWPLIVERKMGAVAAIRASWNALKSDWLTTFGVIFVLSLINFVGAIPCGLGLLFTYPASFLAVTVIYRDLFGAEEMSKEPTIDMPLPPQPPASGSYGSGV